MDGDDEAWSADAAMARIDAGVKRSWLATWEEGSDDDDDDFEGEGEDEDESDCEDADEAEEEADGCRSRSKRRRLVASMLSAVTDRCCESRKFHRRSDTNLTVLSAAPIQN
jgi:TATA-binding protein-associated factor Taf7